MKLKGFAIVSIILLAILTFGAVNATDNVTADDLTVSSDSKDFEISSSYEKITNDGEIALSNQSADGQTVYLVYASENTVIMSDNEVEGNIVTASNLDKFFDEDGILKDDVEFDELIFKGKFNALRECLYITKELTITGDDAELNKMAINILSDNVKLDKLTLTSNTAIGNLINVECNGVNLTNLDISYTSGSGEAVAINIHDCSDIYLWNSTIFFESNVHDDEHPSIAVQALNVQNALIDLNNITTQLPAISVTKYDEDYYMMGLSNVNPIKIKDCSNMIFTRNNIDSSINELIAEFPTIQSIYIIGCSNSLIDHNNISMIDEVTPLGRDNYMYGIDFGFNVNVTFSYNNFLMITNGGKEAAGTDYAFQGVESEVIIRGNNIVSRSNGPNLGIYVASMSGGDSKLLIEDNVINVTGYSSSKGSWALVTGIEIQNGDAQIYNNTIYSNNVNSYDENAYIYGISYAQWMYGDRSFDIRDNTVYTDGKYAVSVINASYLTVENNELYAHELTGDDSVRQGVCENVSIKNNNKVKSKHKIIIEINDCWFGQDNQVNITVVNATGNLTIKVNDMVVASEDVDATIVYTIPSDFIVLGKNTVEAIFNGTESKSASFIAFDFESEIQISLGAVSIGNDVPITVSIPGATGNVTIIVDGKEHLTELKNGVATHSIEKITAGAHDIVAVYYGDGKKLPAINTTVFSVDKLNPLAIITSVGLQYAKKTFAIRIMNETAVNVTINGMSYSLINGFVNVENGLDAGEYSVVVTSAETEKYNARSTSSTFKVVKQTSNIQSIDVPASDIMIGQNATIRVTMAGEETGNVLININGINYTAKIKDKIAILNVNLPVNDYTVNVSYMGDDKYNASASRGGEFKVVDKSKTDIAITVSGDLEIGGEIIISATATSGEKVILIVNGNELTDEKYTIGSAGVYNIIAVSSENNAYYAGFNKTTFTVVKSNSTIDAEPVSGMRGDIITLKINVTDGATGIVLVEVGNNKYFGEINDGKSAVDIIGLVEGNYSALINYSGDIKFNNCSSEVDIIVKANAEHHKQKANAALDVKDVNVGEDAIVNVTLPADATGAVEVLVDGRIVAEEKVTNVTLIVSVGRLSAGNHTVEIRYSGDKRYDSLSETADVNVEKLKAAVKADAIEITEGETATLIVNVDGGSGVVLVNVGGKQFYAIVNSQKASVDVIGLTAANYTANVIYMGDEEYGEASTTVDINVKSKPADKTASLISIAEINDTAVHGFLKCQSGRAIANATVDYVIGNKASSVLTDNDGAFIIQGQQGLKIIISYGGNNTTLACNTTITINYSLSVRTGTTLLANNYTQYAVDYYAGERGQNFTVQLKDANGNVLSNKTVLIGYNGKTLERTTNATGHVNVQINLKDANRLTFAVVFLGDNVYDATMSVYVIAINKKPITISASAKKFKATAKTKKYTVTLKTIKGSSADGKTYFGGAKKVTLTINGKTFTAKTNKKGQATFKITNLNKKGKFTASISYAGDKTYVATKKSVKITVN